MDAVDQYITQAITAQNLTTSLDRERKGKKRKRKQVNEYEGAKERPKLTKASFQKEKNMQHMKKI